MPSENLTPLEELKRLESQVDSTETLEDLQLQFARMEEIARGYPGDFEIQLLAHDLKQRILAHGSRLREALKPAVRHLPPTMIRPSAVPAPRPEPPPPPPPIASGPPAEESRPLVVPTEKPPKRARKAVIGWIAAGLMLAIAVVILMKTMQEREKQRVATAPVEARIATTPPGASIQVNGEQTCVSDCVAKLAPGTYHVTAFLEGYAAISAEMQVLPREGAALKLPLTRQPVGLRVLAEMAKGQVFLDGQPAGELQDGQWKARELAPGVHSLRVAGGASEASFTFEVGTAGGTDVRPVVQGPVTAKNVLAAVVASVGDRARLVASTAPLKVSLNGTPQADATAEGLELAGYAQGNHEILLGEGKAQKTLAETFDAAPALTVFLKTDQNFGSLVVSAGVNDASVFVNNKDQQRKTQNGQLWIQTIGKVTVRVEKEGFEKAPEQVATVEKGQVARLAFTLKELPKVSSLVITGATAGAQVLVDQKQLGTVATDGTFRNTAIAPGNHMIELRREQFEPKRLTRTFAAGQTVTISGGDAVLAAVRVVTPPPPPAAPAAKPAETASVPSPAPPPSPPPPPSKPVEGGMAAFDTPSAWKQEDGVWRHRGEAQLTYSLPPNGVFTFSIYMLRGGSLFSSGRVRWFLNYTDSNNYALFELDQENFWTKIVRNGKITDRTKVAHKQDKAMRVWNIQIDVNGSRTIHKIQGDNGWEELDTWSETGRDFTKGKFGILVNGSDEVGISNFHFTGR